MHLAPIDSYTNLPFRLLCQRYGAKAGCVPLVGAQTIARDAKRTRMIDAHPDEKNVGVQLVGSEPEAMGAAAAAIVERCDGVKWLNINCGCPSSRTMGSGGGSALLAEPEKIIRSIASIKKHTDLPLSAKIRIKDDVHGTIALCRQMEEAGIDFIIIHARKPGQMYSGKADWPLIKNVHEAVGVPVVGNGDIQTASEGQKLVREGYCDSFMIGRAAMSNPMVFSDKKPGTLEERRALLDEHMDLYREYVGEPNLADLKLKAMNFIAGTADACSMRNKIARAKTIDEILMVWGKN